MPKVKEVTVSYSSGGKVQVVDFNLSTSYHISLGKTVDVSDVPDDEVDSFVANLTQEIRDYVDPIASQEVNALWEERMNLNGKA